MRLDTRLWTMLCAVWGTVPEANPMKPRRSDWFWMVLITSQLCVR